jgi:hypothetical protein
MPLIKRGDPLGLNKYPIIVTPTRNKITNANITNNINANLATKEFDSKKPEDPLDVEKNPLLLIYYI